MKEKRVSVLILYSIIFFILSCLVDLILLTVDGDQAEPVYMEISCKREISTGLEGYRVSPSGKKTILSQKFFDKAGHLIVRSEVSNIYYTGIGLSCTDTSTIDKISNVKLHIGKTEYLFSSDDLLKVSSHEKNLQEYNISKNINTKFSLLPPFKTVINWSGDGELGEKITKNNAPILCILLLLCFLYSSKSKKILLWLSLSADAKYKMSAIITVITVLYRMPYQLYGLGEGVDMSWVIGLNWLQNEGTNWGTDVIFTYGPYYWMLVPSIILEQNWLIISFVFTILVYGIAVYVPVVEITDRLKAKKIPTQICVLFLLLIIFVNYSLPDIVLISSLILLYKTKNGKGVIVASLLLATISLTKFGYFIVSITIIFVYVFFTVINNGVQRLAILVTAFSAFVVILWLCANQHITNLPIYIRNSFEITNGYSEAMSTALWKLDGPALTNYLNVSFLLYAIIILMLIGILLFVRTKETKIHVYILLMGFPLLFLAFKEGFVRFDKGHFAQFFEQVILVIVAYNLFLSEYVTHRSSVQPLLTILLFMNLLIVDVKLPGYEKKLFAVLSEGNRKRILSSSKEQLKASYPLSSELKLNVGEYDVDVFPWDIGMLYAHNMKWMPRPIFQSYSVYTSALSNINASFIKAPESPQRVIYTVKTIDDRNPMYDEPLILPELIKNYDVVDQNDNTYVLFKKRTNERKVAFSKILSDRIIKLNQEVDVPAQASYSGLVLAKVCVDLTILGTALNFFYKVPPLKIVMNDKNNKEIVTSRIVRRTAKDGILVSSYVNSIGSFESILDKKFKNHVSHFKIIGNNLIYDNSVKISFYSLNY